jgi:hypothetical protein
MKKSLSQLFNLPIEEVREHFNITEQFTWAVNRLKEQREALMLSGNWIGRQDELKYLDESISHFQGNLDEYYRGINSGVKTKLGDEHYEKDCK